MADFEDLRMIDLVEKFKNQIVQIQETRSAKLFKEAGATLQDIYNFHLTADNRFTTVEHYLKNLYTSFNYAAVIVNDAIKKKILDKENAALLDECLEVMYKCCVIIISQLKKKK